MDVRARLALACAVGLLGGCGTLPDFQSAARAYDEALALAEGAVCRAPSVRSVFDRYGRSPQLWSAYLTLCGYAGIDPQRPEGSAIRSP